MADEVAPLSGEQIPLADSICSIDAKLDKIESDQQQLVEAGLRGGGAAGAGLLQRQEVKNDADHSTLLQERAALVQQLKALRGDS